MNRRGFTLIELLVVVVIIGILVNIAIPTLQHAKRKADAARVVSDFNTIRFAAFDTFADIGRFPRAMGWNRVPPEFAGSLPGGFEFRYKNVVYRWRRWSLPNGLPRRRARRALLAVQIRTGDRQLMQAIQNAYKGESFGNRRRFTFVIE